MSIRITFARFGYANNSSSSHSIIFSDGTIQDGYVPDGASYGWDNFTLASKDEKERYYMVNLASSLHDVLGLGCVKNLAYKSPSMISWAKNKVAQWVSTNIPEISEQTLATFQDDKEDGSIDHDSTMAFPCYRDVSKGLNVEFAQAFMHEVLKPNYVVLGGNDNSDAHPLSGLDDVGRNALRTLYRMLEETNSCMVLCEKDEKTGEFILSSFNGGNLLKVRFEEDAVAA